MCGKFIFLVCVGFFPGVVTETQFLLNSADDYPECKKDLIRVFEGADKGELWALKILDSSTKFPSGILTGHLTDFGNFDECLEDSLVKTHYCPAVITPPNAYDSNSSISFSLRWAYCLPASCPPLFLQNALQQSLQIYLKINATVLSTKCVTNEKKTFSKEDILGVSIWGIFICGVILSSMYDVGARILDREPNDWLSSFSVYRNGKKLLNTEVPPDTMTPLHGLRFLSICWVILGHRYFFTIISSLINLTEMQKEIRKVQSQFFIQGVLAVDTFFLLSGLLNSYYLMKVLQKCNRFPFGAYYIHRYIRLTPPLAAVVLMYATWYYYIGSGPAWDETTSVWRNLCVENWWPTLLYINNYYNPVAQCAGQSWYLAVDMQLYWLSPLVVLPLWKWPKYGLLFLRVLLIFSTFAQFLIAYIYKFRMPFSFGINSAEDFEKILKLLYVPTHTRATPYIVGIMIGYYLHILHSTKSILAMPKVLVIGGWLLSTVTCLSVVFGNFQFSRPIEDHPYNRWESSTYIALHRVGWSFGVGWVIIACLNKSGGFVSSLLSWKFFFPLSRLTYCIFLCHMSIQQFHIGTMRTPDYVQHFNQIHRFFGDLCMSIIAAAALSLTFESPILVLEKLVTGRNQRRAIKGQTNQGFEDENNTPQV